MKAPTNKIKTTTSVRLVLVAVALLAALSALVLVQSLAYAAPANDNVANAQPLASAWSQTVYGNNTGATLETDEYESWSPEVIPWATVWYKWTPTQSGTATFDTKGSTTNTDPILGVWGSQPNWSTWPPPLDD